MTVDSSFVGTGDTMAQIRTLTVSSILSILSILSTLSLTLAAGCTADAEFSLENPYRCQSLFDTACATLPAP